MKKRILIFTAGFLLVLVLGFTLWFFYGYSLNFPGDTEDNVRKKLIAHYNPGSCYGMPTGGGMPSPDVDLKKTRSDWKYTVSDGKCCDIKIIKGTVTGKGDNVLIKETSSVNENVPC